MFPAPYYIEGGIGNGEQMGTEVLKMDELVVKYRKKLAAYEYEKKRLRKLNLSADEYELEIAKVIERLKL